jgi:hypothetical protein
MTLRNSTIDLFAVAEKDMQRQHYLKRTSILNCSRRQTVHACHYQPRFSKWQKWQKIKANKLTARLSLMVTSTHPPYGGREKKSGLI